MNILAYAHEHLAPMEHPLISSMFSSLNVKLLRLSTRNRNFSMTLVEAVVVLSVSRYLATALMPSLCAMFVYRLLTSIVTKIAPLGAVLISSNLLMKFVVSLMYDLSFCTIDWRWWSTYSAIDEVGLFMTLVIGLPGMFSLWTFDSR